MLLQPVAVLAGTVTWDANAATAGQTDGAGAWLNANQWWTGSANQTWVSGDDAVFGNTGAGGAVTLASPTVVNSLTFNSSFTGTYTLGTAAQTITLNSGLTMNSGAGAVTIISPITLGGVQSWTHNDDSLLTVQTGALFLDAYQLTLNIGSTGGITISSAIGGTGSIVKSGAGAGMLTLSSTTSNFSGGVSVAGGTLIIGADTTPTSGTVTAGPLGLGTLTLDGGTVQINANPRQVANPLVVTTNGGTFTHPASNNNRIYFNGGATFDACSVNLNFPSGWSSTELRFDILPVTWNGDVTFTKTGTGNLSTFIFMGGMSWSANRVLTFNTGTQAVNFRGPLSGGNNTLTLKGSGTAAMTFGDATTVVSGTSGGVIVDGPTVIFSVANIANTFTGGVTAKSGTVQLSDNGTSSPNGSNPTSGSPVISGPVGTGTLTLDGGTITGFNNKSTTLANVFSVTANGGAFTKTSGTATTTITLNGAASFTANSTVTVSNPPGNGALSLVIGTGTSSVSTSGPVVFIVNNASVTINGAIAGSGSPMLTARGPGTLTLANSTGTASTFGNGNIGDGTTFSGSNVGGGVSFNTLNAIGSGNLIVNYGGSLTSTLAGNVTNTITVNAGGSFTMQGNYAYGGVTVNSMGALAGANNAFAGTLNVPQGVLFGNATITSLSNLPTLTGTLAIGGTGALTINPAGTTPVQSASSAGTVAFNASAVTTFTDGIVLNANLTIAGSGNTGLTGMVPTGAAGALGTVNGAYTVTVNMAPAGAVSFTSGTTKLTTLTVNSGTAIVSTDLGTNTAQLNGGVIRLGTAIPSNINIGANGGAIETASALTYSGVLTDSGVAALPDLVLRTVGANLTVSGASPAFDQGFTLASAGTPATVIFSTTDDSTGAAGNTIVVPAGIAFGFGDTTRAANTIGKFSTSTDSVLNWGALGGAVNLSSSGLNKNVWLGLSSATSITGYTLPDGETTYKIVPVVASTIGNSVFSGGNALIVSTGVVPTDSASSATAVLGAGIALTLTAAQSYTGTTEVRGTVKNALMGGGVSAPTVTLANNGVASQGDLSATTSITLTRNAVFNVAGTAANYGRITAANVPITVMGGAILNDGETVVNNEANNRNVSNRIAPTATLTLGGSDGGGTFSIPFPDAGAYTHSQTLASLSIGVGLSSVQSSNTRASTVNLAFTGTVGGAGYTRTVGGLFNQVVGAGFNPSFANVPTSAGGSTVSGSGGNEILVGALTGFAGGSDGGDFIKAAAGNFGPAAYTTQANAGSWAAGQNIKTGAAVSGTVAADLAINSLRWNVGAGTLTIADTKTLTINSGMLAFTVNGVATITGGNLTTGNGVDLIVGSNQNSMVIASKITGNLAFTKFLANMVALSNPANEIGDIYSLAGTLQSNAAGAIGSTGSTDKIYLYGGGIGFANSTNQNYAGRKLVVGPVGGTYTDGGTAAVSSLGGTITLNGNLNVTGTGDKTLSNAIGTALGVAGGGQGTITAQTNAGRLTLSGDNQNWTGGLRVGDGMQVRLNSTNAAGDNTAPIVNHSGVGIIEFTSNFGTSLANNIVGSAGTSKTLIANAKTSAVTLSGKIYSVGGLTFQGYDDGAGNVGETILSGTVSLSGPPDIYSYGDASNVQRFVNAQGGINLGVTGRQTAAALAYGTTGFLAVPGGTTTAVENGAEGYVRFGGTQSLIPGAVGPGYVAAIRKGGATALNFGYLLTGSSGAGTTYTLPEGKSFVIGSLGSGTQVGGTFGVAGDGVATFLGNRKLVGAEAGDINVHANAADSVQTNYFLARASADVLKMGNSTTNVVICPTYGDSGATSAITLMRDRTGGTGLTKLGVGTQEVVNVGYSNVAHSASARNTFTWNVDAGTLMYYQFDGAEANFAGFNVNSGGTLGGTGKLNSAVSVVAGGTVALGTNTTFEVASLNMATNSYFRSDIANLGVCGKLTVGASGSVALNGAELTLSGAEPTLLPMTLIDNKGVGAVTGTFSNLAERTTFMLGAKRCRITYVGGDGNDVVLQDALGGTVILFR